MLRVIDIAHPWQDGIDPAAVDCDAVVVKVSGGTSYTNPKYREWADAALAAGKLLGLYHYACEYNSEPGGRAEAEYFWARAEAYAGRAVLILDWENHALSMPASYAKAFLDRIAELSGSTPMFYAGARDLNSKDYSAISGYPLWMASYLNRYAGSGWIADPVNTWGMGDWDRMAMYQYTSMGRVKGWMGNLDLSVFYGNRADWIEMEDNMSDAFEFMAAKTDASGRGKKADMRTRLAWMAAKQETMQGDIDLIEKKVDKILKALEKKGA